MPARAKMGAPYTFHSGVIESIDADAELAVVMCDDGVTRQVRTSVLPAKGLTPAVGERWMLDYKYGHWILGAIIGWHGAIEGSPGPAGPPGPPGRPGDGVLHRWYGHGPPGLIIGAAPDDEYIDVDSGDLYTLS